MNTKSSTAGKKYRCDSLESFDEHKRGVAGEDCQLCASWEHCLSSRHAMSATERAVSTSVLWLEGACPVLASPE